ncbi:hypothetical protein BC643_4557 [Mangrovibacterium diazotrophicum]|uniref:Uncharacterized protein n=2 Tax=Mangrovibacterium diazotrophicum TaxID=1261403 RepID=A0A419VU37_9BACT|nr:hypothetical protein BC643_4557 [Mangrovibacterium diazotrophicum]
MKLRLELILLLIYFGLNQAFGKQAIYQSNFPEGLYQTKEDFLKKTPSLFLQLTIDKIKLVNDSDSLARRCFFKEKDTNKKIKKVFAISHNGQLYFSNWAILDNKSQKDKSVSPVESMNSFVRVLIGGDNFLYAEGAFVNPWQTGFSAGVAEGVGGIIGSELGNAIDKSYPITTFGGTGVVWDIKNEEFNIFRNCSDFNDFVENFPVEKIDCGKQIFELKQIREILNKIK